MLKSLVCAVALATLAAAPAQAAPCRDASGKFVKCDTVKPQTTKCKDAKGKFAKCGTPGAVPAK